MKHVIITHSTWILWYTTHWCSYTPKLHQVEPTFPFWTHTLPWLITTTGSPWTTIPSNMLKSTAYVNTNTQRHRTILLNHINTDYFAWSLNNYNLMVSFGRDSLLSVWVPYNNIGIGSFLDDSLYMICDSHMTQFQDIIIISASMVPFAGKNWRPLRPLCWWHPQNGKVTAFQYSMS